MELNENSFVRPVDLESRKVSKNLLKYYTRDSEIL